MAFDREQMQERAASLAVQGVYVGTSSWKYEGWLGQLYSSERYEYRGKLAKTRFERDDFDLGGIEISRVELPDISNPKA